MNLTKEQSRTYNRSIAKGMSEAQAKVLRANGFTVETGVGSWPPTGEQMIWISAQPLDWKFVRIWVYEAYNNQGLESEDFYIGTSVNDEIDIEQAEQMAKELKLATCIVRELNLIRHLWTVELEVKKGGQE